MQEKRLVGRVLAGDPTAQREFYDTQVDRVFRLAYRMTGSEEAAKECTQETFIKAFDKLGQFRGDSALSTWMHSVTVSTVLGHLRRVKRQREREEKLALERLPGGVEPDGDLVDQAIAAAVEALASIYRTVVVMHDIEGYTHEEIGRQLGISPGTSKVRLSRARAQLREALSDFAEEFAR